MNSLIAAQAPSNIALIKYMGKIEAPSLGGNLPTNGSLSLTLGGLCSVAEVAIAPGPFSVRWSSEAPVARFGAFRAEVPQLSDSGSARMIRHVERVHAQLSEVFGPLGLRPRAAALEVRAANTFPAASGIASSASSFAAVTLASAAALCDDRDAFERAYQNDRVFRRRLARLSRQGSGSSCRSFEGPWVEWNQADAALVDAPRFPALTDFVVLVGREAKKVSSSEAHARVKTSPLWERRVERVSARLEILRTALVSGDFAGVARAAWAEMWEMHSLFHTSAAPFSYWLPGSVRVLNVLKPWVEAGESLIVTMDAGPNVHVLVPTSDAKVWRSRLAQALPDLELLEDQQGQGASLLAGTAR